LPERPADLNITPQAQADMNLKNLPLLLIVAAVLAVSGCTAMDEVGSDVATKFDEGITGQGRLVSPNQTADSFGSYYD
jgi:hypothetical protein